MPDCMHILGDRLCFSMLNLLFDKLDLLIDKVKKREMEIHNKSAKE